MTVTQPLPVVLLPGFMLDDTLWDDYLLWASAGRNYLRLPLSPGTTLAEIVAGYEGHLPERFVIAGFSLGGYVARAVTEHYAARVAGMILIATSLRDDTAKQKQLKQTAAMATLTGTFHGLSAAAIRPSVHPDSNPLLIQRIREMGVRLGAEAFRSQSLLNRTSITRSAVHCPVLVISAREDNLRSAEEAKEVAECFAPCESRVVDHCGHMIPLEQPQKLAEMTNDWLAKNHL